MFNLRALKLTVALLATSTLAQGDHSSEESQAQITDPQLECTPYYYPPADQWADQFPTTWQPATIVENDSDAQAMWANISKSVPTNIQPKGQITGSTIGVDYDSNADPDCWWTESLCTKPKLAGLSPDVASVPEPRTLGYGFDDGPNCTHNAFYNYLSNQNQKATMFYIGSNVRNWPLQAQHALADGHEICVHTWSHNYMTAFTSEDAFAELWYTMKIIKFVTGVTPTCWRPPFGDVDDRIRAIANALGLQTILWKYDTLDWQSGVGDFGPADVDGNYWLLINNLTAGNFDRVGAIVLTHELKEATMKKAIEWYPRLKSHFSHLVPVGVALNKTYPYKEGNYSIPTFEQYIGGQVTISGNNNP